MKLPLIIRRVVGHSMEPTLKEGRIIMASPLLGLRRGDVVIARVEDREIIKRIEKIEPEGYVLAGDNPTHSRDSRRFGLVGKSSIMGRVIGAKNADTFGA